MHRLVRGQYRGGMTEADRTAFLFTNVVDAKGAPIPEPALPSAPGRSTRSA